MAAGTLARQPLQRAIAVDDLALRIDDLQGAVEAVGDGLDQLGLGDTLAELQEAREQAEDEENAGHRQQRQHDEHQRLGDAAGQQQHAGQGAGHHNAGGDVHPARSLRPFGRLGTCPPCCHAGQS